MKTTIIVLIALAIGFGAAYLLFSPGNSGQASSQTGEAMQQYTCGMHPEIISDEPGYCPICEMKLTPKKDGAATEGSVRIDPTTSHNMGLVTTEARHEKLKKAVRTFGKVAFAEPRVHAVNLKIDGWVERLFVDYEGQPVHKGQPLMQVYSPALVAAQKEYLIAHNSGGTESMGRLVSSSRTRLSNWDISDDQIEQLVSTGEVQRTMTIVAPADGIVVSKNVAEGDRLKPGADLYRIADLSEVWITAHVYEQDVPFVREGQTASLSFPNLGGERITGTVSYVAPFLDSQRQLEIRLNVDNRDGRLRPEMYAEVTLESALPGKRLVVPRSAVINSGARTLVYVAGDDGTYTARQVKIGAVGEGDIVEISDGLSEGDPVVVSGQFLLDSESRLSEALSEGYVAGHQHDDDTHSDMDGHEDVHDHGDGSGVYTCPMPEHYHITQYGGGKCPECNMDLVPVEETDNREVYVCPMRECGVAGHEPGHCPKCNMKLEKLNLPAAASEPEEAADEHAHDMDHLFDDEEPVAVGGHDIYTCPMPSHYHVLQYGAGNCSECGMKLVPLAETDNDKVYVCPMSECGVTQDEPGQCPVCGMNLVKYRAE